MIGEVKQRPSLLMKVSYGSSFLKIARLCKVTCVLVLTTLTCVSLLSCSSAEPSGVTVQHGMPPALRLVCGDYSVVAMRNGFTWPTDSKTRVVQENPFVPPPDRLFVVQPGGEVTFRIEGAGHRPQAATLSLSYHQDYPDPQTPRRVIASEDITEFSSQGGAFTFKWRLPEGIPAAGEHGDNELPIFDLNVGVKWTEPRTAEVKYIAVLASPDVSSIRSAVHTCERFFHAAWSGQKNVLVELMDPKVLAEREKGEEYPDAPEEVAPLSVHEVGSSWERILWQSDRYSFKLKSDPEVSIASLDRYDRVPHYVGVELRYSVEATDKETRRKST